MRWTRRLASLAAVVLTATLVGFTPAQAAPASLDECSASLYHGDRRLGPEQTPVAGPVGRQLFGYSRTGNRPAEQFFTVYYDAVAGSWKYPPQDGYVLTPAGDPVKAHRTLRLGRRIDRYGSEFGAFLAPEGLPYTTRSIPPQNLVGTPAEGCNYHVYQVAKAFQVDAGPIAPWFYQTGGGVQYQLVGSLVPGAPARLTVLWLLDNGYLTRLR
ncbi:TNT domain-containing protein [Amycolatopsis sp. H20-H5]|uniref:TNT domain-containing protein n=1 Tax=Amycolatopsis sp. H20-H5 TaxID=3046309 RepID=UPI002DB78ADB|nr:TNT domain-containing protein [Amycolatopsis sp. H20-H5]MEC3976399.1 TNT domain-containing protein [Amycolatopsis sp. H20-H5]